MFRGLPLAPRWPRGGRETLAALRAAVVPEGEIVLESTANGAAGVFYEEWQKAAETGYQQHFFPWWFEASYHEDLEGKSILPFTEEEQALVNLHGLSEGQISWRRTRWSSLRALAAQEYAEDPISCFLASGECVFDMEAVDKAAAMAGRVLETQDNGRLRIWFPAHGGEAVHHWGGSGGGRIRGRLCLRAGDRADAGIAMRGVAWTPSSV